MDKEVRRQNRDRNKQHDTREFSQKEPRDHVKYQIVFLDEGKLSHQLPNGEMNLQDMNIEFVGKELVLQSDVGGSNEKGNQTPNEKGPRIINKQLDKETRHLIKKNLVVVDT